MSVMCLVETQVEDTLVLMVFDCSCIDICDMISILKLGHKLNIIKEKLHCGLFWATRLNSLPVTRFQSVSIQNVNI